MISGFEIVSTKTATPRKCVHCHQPIVRDKDNGGLGFTYHHKETNQQWGPEPSILGDDSHYAEPHDGYYAEEMHSRTAALTLTAKEVGYYVVSRNGVPISGPYATRSDAAPNMIEQRGAAVMFIGPGNSSEWDALKAKQFPFGLNTVNGSRHTAWGPDQHNPEVGLDFHEFPEDPEYIDPLDYEDYDDDDEEEWDVPQRWEASRHTAGTMADGKTPVRQHKFKEDSNWGDESGCTVCGQSKGHGNHTDRAQATASGKLYDVNGKYASCSKCDYTYTGQDHADAMSKINQHLDDKHNGGWSTSGSMEERYATVRRLGSLRHFAEDEDDLGYEKQPKGLGDQVDTGMAPASEIQDPNPLAGQDLERIPRNLAEAALWAQAGYCPDCAGEGTLGHQPCQLCGGTGFDENEGYDNPDYPQDTPHDQLDDPWNGQENPLGRGWGDPPLGY